MQKIAEKNTWMFPDVSYLADDNIGNVVLREQIKLLNDQINLLNQKLAEKDTLVNQLTEESAQLKMQIEEMKDSNIKLFDNLNLMLNKMNETNTTNCLNIIHKVIRKIIQREISHHPDTLTEMIENIVKKLNSEAKIIIELSTKEYQLIQSSVKNQNYTLKENKSLENGDIVVTTDSEGLMFNLDQAIAKLLGR